VEPSAAEKRGVQAAAGDELLRLPRSRLRVTGQERRPGKEPGEPDTALCLSGAPDQTAEHRAALCAECAANLSDAAVFAVQPRHVMDPSVLRPRVVEHRIVAVADVSPFAVDFAVPFSSSTHTTRRVFFRQPTISGEQRKQGR
jgi:hypothetical protein